MGTEFRTAIYPVLGAAVVLGPILAVDQFVRWMHWDTYGAGFLVAAFAFTWMRLTIGLSEKAGKR